MRKSFVDSSENDFIWKNRKTIFEGIFGTKTPIQVESSVAFARYLHDVGANSANYLLFFKILETNNKWVIDALMGKRDPRLLFSIIKPNRHLTARAFKLLSLWHPEQVYLKVLLAILGIIENCYYKPDEGHRIYSIDISDMNNFGKFLDEEKDQYDAINTTILDILDRLTRLGEFKNDIEKSMLSKHAFNIRIAYFDHTKSLTYVIPAVLLVRLRREDTEVSPTPYYLSYLEKAFVNVDDNGS